MFQTKRTESHLAVAAVLTVRQQEYATVQKNNPAILIPVFSENAKKTLKPY